MNLAGQKIAIFGLGRSGLGIGRAALALGAEPRVYDESPKGSVAKQEAVQEAERIGLPVTFGWDGTLPPDTTSLVLNPAVRKTHPKIQAALDQGVEVIGEVEFGYRISKAPIVAITGTNGKSTTTVMTYLCLKACGVHTALCGNIFGSGYPEMSLTDAALSSTPDQVLVAEISSFQLEWIRDFRPVSAGITNIWPDHLDRYESFEEYGTTKQKLFSNMKAGDYVVIRANDPVVAPPGGTRSAYVPRGRRTRSATTQEQSLPRVFTFGATGNDGRVEERDLVLVDKHVSLDSLPFREPHNYQNACMAALLAYGALLARGGKTEMPDCVVEGLRSFRGLSHRMELVGDREGVRVINNSMCTNPDAVIKSVQAVKDRTHILMGGVNKNLDFGPLRHYLANHRHQAYLYGADARQLSEMLGGGFPIYASMEDAFREAVKNATKGEVVMLAPGCASMDSFSDFRERGDVFKAIAKDWLNHEPDK